MGWKGEGIRVKTISNTPQWDTKGREKNWTFLFLGLSRCVYSFPFKIPTMHYVLLKEE